MIQTYFYGGIQLLRLHLGGERGSSKYERMQTGEMAKDGVGGGHINPKVHMYFFN